MTAVKLKASSSAAISGGIATQMPTGAGIAIERNMSMAIAIIPSLLPIVPMIYPCTPLWPKLQDMIVWCYPMLFMK